LDGNINQTFLVTSSTNIVVNLLNFTVNLVDSLLGIQSIEPDKLLPVPQTPLKQHFFGAFRHHAGELLRHPRYARLCGPACC